jgi:hypothetical protein
MGLPPQYRNEKGTKVEEEGLTKSSKKVKLSYAVKDFKCHHSQ